MQDEIVAKINEQSQPDVRNPQLEEQISVDVLGKRSNYLKGYGIHKNKYATHSQAMPNPEVDALKQVVADQAKVVADQAKIVADYSTRLETMMLFVATKFGVDPATIPGFIPGSENGEDTLIL